ncbi:sortase [Ruminococcus sp. 5_1_39BFAA]|uniref:sortase n=1 Tax=Ruminococcus sp. 5_1_39BFAA TaxID=457412 RepID=UPI003566CAB1
MRNKIGTFCMVMGTVLVLAALSLYVGNQREAEQAERAVDEIMPQLHELLEIPALEIPTSGIPNPFDPAMTEVEIDGYYYIGYLSVPSLGLELPVMSEWDYTRLKIAPCRYAGSTKTDDLVIAAHNYARHFGTLTQLSVGDTVLFTDMDNVVSRYEVAELETLEPTAIESMTAGEYDLTLFTCTYGGKSRVTVRCDRVDAL